MTVDLADGARDVGLRVDVREEPVGDDPAGTDAFRAMNREFGATSVHVEASAGAVVTDPVVVVHHVESDAVAVFPRLEVRTGDQAELTIVELVSSADVTALLVPEVQLVAGPASNLRYLNVQRLGARAWQIAHHASTADRDATVSAAVVALGGDYARVHAHARLVGEGATSNLIAVYFGDGRQMHDFRTTQDHAAPRTTSDLLFKGAVEDEAHSVYSGLIRVRKGAAGTNAFQTNRNLVLTEGARADSVPNLEIEENDVRCSHASAVGPVDEEQRYYLEARGVPTDAAERLIVLGFFADVIERTPVPALRHQVRAAVAAKLDGTRG